MSEGERHWNLSIKSRADPEGNVGLWSPVREGALGSSSCVDLRV